MTDMTAFEQQLSAGFKGLMGPSQPVDDAAILSAITATQRPRWRIQPMFSATRFVLAGAVVALFGGLLLAGWWSQPREDRVPAAVTASPSTSADLLPGVELVTEEVEPGVYKVLNDGVRALAAQDDPSVPYGDAYSVVVGQDGGVWSIGPDRDFYRLGDPTTHRWPDEPVLIGDEDIAIGPDGTLWAANDWRPDGFGKGMHLVSYDGSSWTDAAGSWTDDEGAYGRVSQVEVGPDGAVWAYSGGGSLFVRDADGWTRWGLGLGDRFHISGDGTRWMTGSGTRIKRDVSDRLDASPSWEAIPFGFPEQLPQGPTDAETAISPDGTVWMHVDGGTGEGSLLARFDGDVWSSWNESDGVPAHIETASWWGLAMAAAPDGSVWLVSGERDDEGAVCDGRASAPDRRVSRFDGAVWSHYLDGLCIHALDVTPDGTAWVRASAAGAVAYPVELYAITPEAAAMAPR